MKSGMDQLREIYEALTDKQRKELQDRTEELVGYYKTTHPFRWLKRMYATADAENESLSKESSCKKGCAFCCHIRVAATDIEAKLIVQFCKQNDIPIDTGKLERLQHLNEQEYMLSLDKRCTFLADDNTCKIYEVRPFNCRNYFVTSPPEDCDTDSKPHGHVIAPFTWGGTIVGLALMNVSETNSLPYMLLKNL